MSENLKKIIGVAVVAAIVVVGIVVTNDDDVDFTRNMALPGASPLLEGQGDLTFELLEARIATLDERIRTVEKFLTKEELVELTGVARTLVNDTEALVNDTEVLVSDTEALVNELTQHDIEARSTSRLLLSDLREAADVTMGQIEGGGEIDGGWLDVLDLMCQLQLSSWGRTATQASAVSDAGDPFTDIRPFWACRYDNLNIPELEEVQQSELVGVCLPGDQPRQTNGFVVGRGLGWDPIFAESINRWVFRFRPTDENVRAFDVFCH